MSQSGGRITQFGPFRYDPEQRLLFRGRDSVPLEPKLLDTLHVLLERQGQVVEKGELMKLVWPDATVEEVGLARNISLLRKALGGDPEQYIETVPKRGYRFIAAAGAAPSKRWLWLVGAVGVLLAGVLVYWQFYLPSKYLPRGDFADLAVIPFTTLSSDLQQSGFSLSFNELLTTELSKQKPIRVVSPNTVQRYQWVGIGPQFMARLLGVEVMLQGTAQTHEGRRRVTTRLADVHSGKLIWAETYDQAETDAVLARVIAAEVAKRLAEGQTKD